MTNEIETMESMPDDPQMIFERFAVAQALYKAVAPLVDTKAAGNLRADAMQALWELSENGTDRVTLRVCGENVGKLSLKHTKEGARVQSKPDFDAWMMANGYASVSWLLDDDAITPEEMDELREQHPGWFKAEVVYSPKWLDNMEPGPGNSVIHPATGEIVPGLEWQGEKTLYQSVVSGCEPEKVLGAMRRHGIELGQAVRALLGDGD